MTTTPTPSSPQATLNPYLPYQHPAPCTQHPQQPLISSTCYVDLTWGVLAIFVLAQTGAWISVALEISLSGDSAIYVNTQRFLRNWVRQNGHIQFPLKNMEHWQQISSIILPLAGGGWSYIFRTLHSIPFFPDKSRYHRIFTLSGLFRTCQAPDPAAEVDPIAHFGHFRSHLATCTW